MLRVNTSWTDNTASTGDFVISAIIDRRFITEALPNPAPGGPVGDQR